MAVTQEVVLNFLLEQGGKVKNSDLVRRFKSVVESSDPQEKANNRELFKKFVNNIAVVKDEEGTKMVVLKKKYAYLLAERGAPRTAVLEEQEEMVRGSREGTTLLGRRTSQQDLSEPEPRPEEPQDVGSAETTDLPETTPETTPTDQPETTDQPEITDQPETSTLHEEDTGDLDEDKRESVFDIVSRMDNAGPVPFPKAWSDAQPKEQALKPHMLPLRYAPSEEINQDPSSLQPSALPKALQVASLPKSPKVSRKQPDDPGSKSPHIKRSSKMQKVSEENKYSEGLPMEQADHEWLVHSTNGRWNHKLLGLLMTDSDLAGKKDFISGFTALHWAAKSGNSEMVRLLFDQSCKSGSSINVNVRSFGGYTPLHIAAIHERKDVILMLTSDYNANVHIRDNSGRKPFHYLKKSAPVQLKFILKDPTVFHQEHAIPAKRNSKVAASILGTTSAFLGVLSDDLAFHDLTKGLKKPGSFNKFFTAPTGVKKKLKARDSYPSISSLCEDPEEPEEIVGKRRPVSEFFSH